MRCALTHPSIVRALILIDSQATIEDQTKTLGYELMINDWVANGLSEQTAATVAYIILGDGWDSAEAWKAKWRVTPPAQLRCWWARRFKIIM